MIDFQSERLKVSSNIEFGCCKIWRMQLEWQTYLIIFKLVNVNEYVH